MNYTLSDLMPTGAEEFRSVMIKETPVYPGSNRMHREYKGCSYIPTAAGRIEKAEWLSLSEEAIKLEEKTELLERIIEEVRRHCAWLRSEKERREYAISCLVSEAYLKWDL